MRRKLKSARIAMQVFVILYGPMDLFEGIGEYLQKCAVYLQDPLHCDRNVLYRNPHRLSEPDGEVRMTQQGSKQQAINIETIQEQQDPFAELETTEPQPETEGPSALATALYRYFPVCTWHSGFYP